MKRQISAIILGLSVLLSANNVFAADTSTDSARIDSMEQQMRLMATSLAQMKAVMTDVDQRLDTLADMEIRLVRMERDLRHMRRLSNPAVKVDNSQQRPMLVPATW